MQRDEARPETPPGGQPRDGAFAPTRLASTRPPVGMWLAVTLIALVAAFVKPWAGEPSGVPSGGRPSASPAAMPSRAVSLATVRPDSAGPLVTLFCLDPQSWRIATVERWRNQTIRVWRAIEPADAASGPDDATIPVFPVVSEGVTELGWCAPVTGPDRPVGVATMDVWRRTAAGPVSIRTKNAMPTGVGTSFGGLYLPPGTTETEVWADGAYVFRHRERTGRDRWFAVEVELRPKPETVRAAR
jgi:hypothetical protein